MTKLEKIIKDRDVKKTTKIKITETIIFPTAHRRFVPKVSVLIFLCTNWQRSTSLMYIGTLVMTLAACPYLFQLD